MEVFDVGDKKLFPLGRRSWRRGAGPEDARVGNVLFPYEINQLLPYSVKRCCDSKVGGEIVERQFKNFWQWQPELLDLTIERHNLGGVVSDR
ncbi:hypothetical protein D9M69_669780 [compost metagenome]